jgi:hypothetical protein
MLNCFNAEKDSGTTDTTTETDNNQVISKFIPKHQTALRQSLNTPEVKTLLSHVSILLKTLKDKKIKLSFGRKKPPVRLKRIRWLPENSLRKHEVP